MARSEGAKAQKVQNMSRNYDLGNDEMMLLGADDGAMPSQIMGDDGSVYMLGDDGRYYPAGADLGANRGRRIMAPRPGFGFPGRAGIPVAPRTPFNPNPSVASLPSTGDQIISFSTGSWPAASPANTQVILSATLQEPTQFKRPMIQLTRSAGAGGVPILLTQFKIGTHDLFVTVGGGIPAEQFDPRAVGGNIQPKTYGAGTQLQIVLINLAAIPAGEAVFVTAGGIVAALVSQ